MIGPLPRPISGLVLAVFILLLPMALGFAQQQQPDLPLSEFFGVYVGRAQLFGADGSVAQERDLDIVIQAGKRGGFRIDWVTVKLVDGRRDLPGVKRWQASSVFEGQEDGRFVEDTRGSLFAKKKKIDLLAGGSLRWARVIGATLNVVSFAILEDGRYELQTYKRIRTETGLDIEFRRIVDDELAYSLSGSAVKVE